MTSDKPIIRIRRKKHAVNAIKNLKETRDFVNQHHKDDEVKLKITLEDFETFILNSLGQTIDLHMENIGIAETNGMLVYLDSAIDTSQLQKTLLNKKTYKINPSYDVTLQDDLLDFCNQMFGGSSYRFIKTFDDAVTHMLNGSIIIAIEGAPFIIAISMPSSQQRQVSEPTSQTVIRGPKDSFVESISTNQSLIRRRIRNPNLRFEDLTIGNETQTEVNIGYINGIANEKIVEEVRRRLKKINVSAIFESGNIEELIADKTMTIFPLAVNTERPDTVAGQLIEGKICILVDGTPFVLLVPAVFVDFFNSSEDYYHNFFISSFLRVVRYIAFLIVLIVPSAYVGILTFHQELIPTYLLINIIAQREGVPFPAVVEVIIMEFTFEILREAGIRMPRAVGQTVSIVGALVIGQAAAQAGLISNIMIIIVAITATANFVAPVYSLSAANRMLRFILIPIASFLGLYGVLLGLIVMVAHLSSLRSFGVPYLAPIAPFTLKDQGDVFVRLPYWALKRRPSYLMTAEPDKQKITGSPTPPDMSEVNNE